jgi:small subunit ribosomal protein S8
MRFRRIGYDPRPFSKQHPPMTDPISDFLTRLRNASKARLDECVMPHSTLKESIAGILKNEGYVSDISSAADAAGHKTLVEKMK